MPQRFPLLLVFFFGSGAAALAYEVVWIRQLSLILSITVYALTTVLCAFMAGLALGAGLSALVADRVRRPVRAFGILELAIALCGISVPVVLANLSPVYLRLHASLGGNDVAFAAGRFVLAFLVLLVPTTLMGVTLPILSRAVIDREGVVGLGTGALYAANTLGAVGGCVAAGFALIPELGLQATSMVAATLNTATGLLAVFLGSNERISPPERDAPSTSPRPSRAAVFATLAFGISGFTAMGYEILWTRALEHYTHNSTYAYSAMLATFLLGLGGGSAWMAWHADRLRRPLFSVGVLQLGIGLTVIAALGIYRHFETWIPAVAEGIGGLTSWPRVVALLFSEAGITMLATTFLLGGMFPLVSRIAVESLGSVGRRIGVVYLLNTVGSILGSLVVGFAVLPELGLRGAFMVLVVTNLGLGAVLAVIDARSRAGFAVAGLAAAGATSAFWLTPAHLFEEQFAARFGPLRFYREEVTDTVMVTEAPDGSRMIRYADGRGTAGTPTVVGDRMYAHVPLLLHPDPKSVLQITFGVGNSLSSVLQYPVEHVDCVELSPGVIAAAPFFRATNRNALADPRVRLVINDGRNFLLTSRDRYDVIRLDPPELHTAGVVNLYTREFYEFARDHLARGGIFSIWVNVVMTPEDDLRMLLRTVLAVFPYVSIWSDPGRYSWIINGSMEPNVPDLALLLKYFSQPAIRSDLESIGIPDPYHFLAYFVFSGKALERFAGTGPLVVDDHTRLDFTVPRSRDSSFGIANYNTDNWLVRFLAPDARHDVALRTFFAKASRMAGYRQSVLSELANVRADGCDRAEVGRRIERARATDAGRGHRARAHLKNPDRARGRNSVRDQGAKSQP